MLVDFQMYVVNDAVWFCRMFLFSWEFQTALPFSITRTGLHSTIWRWKQLWGELFCVELYYQICKVT